VDAGRCCGYRCRMKGIEPVNPINIEPSSQNPLPPLKIHVKTCYIFNCKIDKRTGIMEK
jgi:hypothetical protein